MPSLVNNLTHVSSKIYHNLTHVSIDFDNDVKKCSSMRIGKAVEAYLQHKGWKQIELAKKSGLTPETINRLIHGKHAPEPKTLIAICEALEISMLDLVVQAGSDGEELEEVQRLQAAMGYELTDLGADQGELRRRDLLKVLQMQAQGDPKNPESPSDAPLWVQQLIAATRATKQAIDDQKDEFVGTMKASMDKIEAAMTRMADAYVKMQADLAAERAAREQDRKLQARWLKRLGKHDRGDEAGGALG